MDETCQRPEANWRRMYLSTPAITHLQFYQIKRHSPFSEIRNPNGITLGEVFDAVLATFPRVMENATPARCHLDKMVWSFESYPRPTADEKS
jgi:hypothetical protein